MHQVSTSVPSARTPLGPAPAPVPAPAPAPAPANCSVPALAPAPDRGSGVETSDGASIHLPQALFHDAAVFVYLETVGGTQYRAGPDGNITMIESAVDPGENRDVSRTRAWVYRDCDTWTIGERPRLTPHGDASPILAFTVVHDARPAGSNYLAAHFEARLSELGHGMGCGMGHGMGYGLA